MTATLPTLPSQTKNEAAVRAIGYYLDRPDAADPFLLSGAKALLASYHVLVYAGAAAVTPSGSGETIIVPSHPVHPGTHTRYVGWVDDILSDVTEAEILAGVSSMTDVLGIPARATNGYLFFAVPQSVGYPGSLIIGANPTNQLPAFQQQVDVIDVNGTNHIVGVNPNLLNPAAVAGQNMTLGYGP